ncbi:MAG: glycosyltransferase family 8 protein [Chitinivibrionia bacterium]|nr:glycosyltransferase family 8 protein [Chitinivibrionia bacterium]
MNVAIFFSSNDNYMPYVSVMAQSIMENAQKERKYDFYILHRDIKNETMETLRKQISLFSNFSLNFADMSPHIKDYDFFVSRHVTAETYFRLFIPYIFPDLEKVIYLDGDMICLVDISQLFDIDISDCLVGGTFDPAASWYFAPKKVKTREWKKIFEVVSCMKNPENYINAGMLLINCKKFRETYSMQDIIDKIFSRKWQVHDQDIINVLAEGKIFNIHKSWDYMFDQYAKYLPQNLFAQYLQAQKEPKIIHFKPYAVWYYIPHFEAFWKYATRTSYLKEIVSRMNKNGIIDKKLEDKVCVTIRERTGFGGNAILKTILAFFTRFSGNKKT